MTEKLVSIVLPTWKDSQYLDESIRSCLSQSYREIELIVVDDGCGPASQSLIENAASQDPRVRIARHSHNLGLPKALNTGFGLARGEYFTWTSDDNRYRPNAIETMAVALEANPGIGFVYADAMVIDKEGYPLRVDAALDFRQLLVDDPIGPCFMYRRAIHDEIGGYDEDLFLAEDIDFYLRVSTRYAMMPIREVLYDYREHRGTLTSDRSEEQTQATRRCIEKNLPCLDWAPAKAKSNAYLWLARGSQLSGSWTETIRFAAKAFAASPHDAAVSMIWKTARWFWRQ